MTLLLRLLLMLVACCAALPAHADELRPGYLELTQKDAQHWRMVWKAPVLGGLATRARPAFPEFCTQSPPVARLEGAALVAESTLTCSRDLAGAQVGLAGMEATFTDALVRIAPLDRAMQAERLTRSNTMVTVATVPDRWEVARSYTALGVIHILEGYDHLLFVIALVLLIGRPVAVIKAATAFTLAHSITLAGTTLGLFGLAQAPVEALIALSIVFLAVEIVKQKPGEPRLSERVPWMIAFLFGLLHGFGFAGALREIGLPDGDVPVALLTFNIGVELGQLVIIAACLTLLALIRRLKPTALRPATLAATYLIGITASFWFIERVTG
ncbi:HupE/UreJ family protein [Novosphingobium sp.]|uniref:HupE/UreJ family protein n=1 Tax=Novosphingobium sp. TaxID=1874826 RepID=UPI001EC78381|nr:HupE/UreJ family protein [Novosphingobium sp.]MBK6801263.1 HupE/UreJ family protein [Novosphingobium sp.]MBK9011826.1 HupE/UreJ family protein [Novosphingobium sp.]